MTSGVTVIAVLLLLVWIIPQHGCGTPGSHYRRRRDGAHLQRGAAGRSAGSAAAHRGQPLPCARCLSFAAPGQYSAAAGRACALRALPIAPVRRFDRRTVRFTQLPLAVTGLAAILLVGVTGTLAALSDTLFPASSLSAALAQDFSSSSSWLRAPALSSPGHRGDCRSLHLLAAAAQRFTPAERRLASGCWCCWPAVCAWRRGCGAAGSAVAADYSSAGSGPSVDRSGCARRQDLRCSRHRSLSTRVRTGPCHTAVGSGLSGDLKATQIWVSLWLALARSRELLALVCGAGTRAPDCRGREHLR